MFGPNVYKRSLIIEPQVVRDWILENKMHLVAKVLKKKIRDNMLMVVLHEWVSPTWARVAWRNEEVHPGPTILGLVQESNIAAPQWKFMVLTGRGSSFSSFLGNGQVV